MASRLLGGRFFQPKSHADVQTGRISGMFSQAEFSPLFELSSYTHLGSSVASVSHLSLKFDLRHRRFIITRQNFTLASSHVRMLRSSHIPWRDVTHIISFELFFPRKYSNSSSVSQNITVREVTMQQPFAGAREAQ